MTADTIAAPPEETAPAATDQTLDAANQWAQDYLAKLTGATTKRLARIASNSNGASGGIEPRIGEPTVGQYVAFDVAALSPIQFTGLPPYQPSKVIAAGEAAYLVVYMFVNPMASIPDGFAVPPTVQLETDNSPISRANLRLRNVVTGKLEAVTKADEAGQFTFENVEGGNTTIYGLDRSPTFSHTMRDILDTFILEDPRIMHGVTPILPADGKTVGRRDIFGIDFHYRPALGRPSEFARHDQK